MAEFLCGLVSISFRALTPEQIISAVKDSGLQAIEWGSDVHVPAGDTDAAKKVRAMTEAAGLKMPEYGSYHRIGTSAGEKITDTVSSAHILGTPIVRLWAFDRSCRDMTTEQYQTAVNAAIAICKENPDITFCLECHNNTVTEEYHDTLRFLQDVGCENLQMFWQPNQFRDHAYNIEALKALLPYIHSAHVFAWEGTSRFPLAAHTDRWTDYLNILKTSEKETIALMLEFVHDDKPESLAPTAETLLSWVK